MVSLLDATPRNDESHAGGEMEMRGVEEGKKYIVMKMKIDEKWERERERTGMGMGKS